MDKQIYDPIHGYVSITENMRKIIDTLEFQRLRDLKQLGAACFVFPSATHTRFEHSIGVSYLAKIMVENLKKLGLWDSVMINDLKYYDGSVKGISRIPDSVKELYATAFDIEPRWLIDAASRRQKWIDQSQSLNLYIDEPNGKKLDIMYRMAWLRGLKTTYYLRSRSATTTEKSTISTGELNAVSATAQPEVQLQTNTTAPSACSVLDPDCDACQ